MSLHYSYPSLLQTFGPIPIFGHSACRNQQIICGCFKMLRGIFSSQRHPQWMILVALAFIGAGCASSGRVAEPPPAVHLPHTADASVLDVAAPEHESDDVERLMSDEIN